MNEEEKKQVKDIAKRRENDGDITVLLGLLSGALLKLEDADVMAMAIDTTIGRGRLDERSLIADARLNYGQPHAYDHLDNKRREELRRRYHIK